MSSYKFQCREVNKRQVINTAMPNTRVLHHLRSRIRFSASSILVRYYYYKVPMRPTYTMVLDFIFVLFACPISLPKIIALHVHRRNNNVTATPCRYKAQAKRPFHGGGIAEEYFIIQQLYVWVPRGSIAFSYKMPDGN